jgi:hypothetical protein
LQAVKLRFLRSNSELSGPRYWAAFVLNGDGWSPTKRIVPWSVLLLGLAGILAVLSFALWRLSVFNMAKREQRKAALSLPNHPPKTQTPE